MNSIGQQPGGDRDPFASTHDGLPFQTTLSWLLAAKHSWRTIPASARAVKRTNEGGERIP
jgi:hypothetical protein